MTRFVLSKQGFRDMRNEPFAQRACLDAARRVAAAASARCGAAFGCDVRPGRTRCHARASAPVAVPDIYKRGAPQLREALEGAALALGGELSGRKGAKGKGRRA